MKICDNCGADCEDNAQFCIKCGKPLYRDYRSYNSGYNSQSPIGEAYNSGYYQKKLSSGIYGIIGFFVPLAGLILWLVWKDERPKDAKNAGIGALISIIISILSGILTFILSAVAAGSGSTSVFNGIGGSYFYDFMINSLGHFIN